MAGGVSDLAVRAYGGNGRGLLLIHGLSSNVCIWDLVGPQLATDHRVVAYDQRSHGRSGDGDDYAYPALAADAKRVADHFELDEPIVVGHSWGASVALHFAATYPCSGVICVDGGVLDLKAMGLDWPSAEKLLTPPVLEGEPDQLMARIRREQKLLPGEAVEAVQRRAFVVGEDGIMRRRTPIPEHMRIVKELWDDDTWAVYERVSVPVLAVLARGIERNEREQGYIAAKVAAAERLADRDNVRVEWLDSVHDVPLHAPDQLAELIRSFSASV